MQLNEVFWQNKLSPKQLVVDWDKFITLFQLFIVESISIKLNTTQKEFIKSLIDPQNKNLVYKNSYLLFVTNFWDLPSNRTKFLKGQLNLSKMPKLKFITDLKTQQSVILKISYLSDILNEEGKDSDKKCQGRLVEKIYQWQNNKIYCLDKKHNIISQNTSYLQSFLTVGRIETNNIAIQNCQFLNSEHFKLIKMTIKKQQQKKSVYMYEDQQDKHEEDSIYYIRDISRSNRLQYMLSSSTKYVIMRPGLVVKIGMTSQYEIHIAKATPQDIGELHLKQLQQLLNQDRIDYLGQIDPSIPEKYLLDIPVGKIKNSDVYSWFKQGLNYEEPTKVALKTRISDPSGKNQEEIPLILRLVNKITQQSKDYRFSGQTVKVGRNKNNSVVIEKVTIRNVECEFVCITGVWILKNMDQNCNPKKQIDGPRQNVLNQSNEAMINRRLKVRQLQVGLATLESLQSLQSSNRILLPVQTDHQLGGKHFILNVSFSKYK